MNDDILDSFWAFMQEKGVYSCDVPADIIEKALDFSISEKELELRKRAEKITLSNSIQIAREIHQFFLDYHYHESHLIEDSENLLLFLETIRRVQS